MQRTRGTAWRRPGERPTRRRGTHLQAASAALGWLMLLASCGGDATTGVTPVADVVVDPSSARLWAGDTLRLRATARSASGSTLDGRAATWSCEPNGVAGVDSTGKVTAVGAGEAVVTATIEGRSGEASITVSALDVVFEGTRGGLPEIYRTNLAAGEPQRILPAGTQAGAPTPSPDGTRIAYVVADYTAGTGDIWIAAAGGGNAVQVTHDAELDDEPTWSPDGSRIAFRSYRSRRDSEIWVMDDDGANPENLTPPEPPGVISYRDPAWSPDGSRIAYASTEGGDWGIWAMNADGSGKRQLTNTIELDVEPTWSPGGDRIAFRRTSDAGSDILIVSAGGGDPERLPLPDDQRQPSWSPDGRWILCVTQPGLLAQPEILAVRPDGRESILITSDPEWGGGSHPAWLRR